MMGADLLKKTTDVLNEDLIATRLDGVVTEKSNAVLTVGDKVEATTNRLGGDPVRDADPLESMIKGALRRGSGGEVQLAIGGRLWDGWGAVVMGRYSGRYAGRLWDG